MYKRQGYNSTLAGLKGSPRAAEEIDIARVIILAETLGLRAHVCHVSTRGGVQLLREAKKRGVRVTAETCPHYFTLTDDAVTTFDANTKVNPPLREQADVDAVSYTHLDVYKRQRFALPPTLVAARNGLRAFPPAGALLLLPDVRGKTYTVCAGETLAAVCEKFGLTEESFCRMNACSYVYPTQLVLVGEG